MKFQQKKKKIAGDLTKTEAGSCGRLTCPDVDCADLVCGTLNIPPKEKV